MERLDHQPRSTGCPRLSADNPKTVASSHRDRLRRLPLRASAGDRIRGRAVRTQAEYLEGVADVGVPVLLGNSVGPFNDCPAGDLDGATTRPAQEVMVVLLGALQIDRLAVLARQDVHLAGVHHESQSPVDRTESDVVPALAQGRMDLLGAAKIVELREQISDSLALPRHSSRGETR
jgi:hypothetical protein